MTMATKTAFEGAQPILSVHNIPSTVRYYTDVLGFKNAEWGNDFFTCVVRDRASIYLCQGGQGQSGTWVWVGVEDVSLLYDEYKDSGARIRMTPKNFPWAYEMHVEDLDGHVLRFGSEPLADKPFDTADFSVSLLTD
ncbi:MAG TPA: VOC family protein [Pyrinomonadaceae bacterium]